MDIKAVSNRIHENAKAKGFFDEGDKKNIGEMLMLIVTEVSEAMEADRNGHFYDKEVDFVTHNQGDFFESVFEGHCKNTFEDEMADIVIRVMDMCAFKGIDLEWHILQKIRYNETRPHKHGGKKC
jgi:NTP pyrophosphatase (non-canonical NTP hydrolase)